MCIITHNSIFSVVIFENIITLLSRGMMFEIWCVSKMIKTMIEYIIKNMFISNFFYCFPSFLNFFDFF